MGNLGKYLFLTIAAKKVGGPIMLLGGTFAVGAAAGVCVIKAINTLINSEKKHNVSRRS